jgi:hypothetical protein
MITNAQQLQLAQAAVENLQRVLLAARRVYSPHDYRLWMTSERKRVRDAHRPAPSGCRQLESCLRSKDSRVVWGRTGRKGSHDLARGLLYLLRRARFRARLKPGVLRLTGGSRDMVNPRADPQEWRGAGYSGHQQEPLLTQPCGAEKPQSPLCHSRRAKGMGTTNAAVCDESVHVSIRGDLRLWR